MKRKLITLALLLAAATFVSTAAYAQTPSSAFTEKRIAINVTQAERNQALFEMREFLHGLFNINNAMAKQDMEGVAKAARPMGPMLDRMPANLKSHLPEEFTQLSIAMNEAFETLARDAETKGDKQAHEDLAEVLTYCSGCHDTYRFNVVSAKLRK